MSSPASAGASRKIRRSSPAGTHGSRSSTWGRMSATGRRVTVSVSRSADSSAEITAEVELRSSRIETFRAMCTIVALLATKRGQLPGLRRIGRRQCGVARDVARSFLARTGITRAALTMRIGRSWHNGTERYLQARDADERATSTSPSGYVDWTPGGFERKRFAQPHHAGIDWFFRAR